MILIYVISHKAITLEISAPCTPIYVGQVGKGSKELNDSTGMSIAEKNPFYSELTAQYWVWKNALPHATPDSFIGFCHYRRFFTFDTNINKISELNEAEIRRNLQEKLQEPNGVILANPIRFPVRQHWLSYSRKLQRIKFPWQSLSLLEQYEKEHNKDDLITAANLLPNKFKYDFLEFLTTNKEFSPFNMYIARPKILNAYFEILFPWLECIEKTIDLKSLPTYQARMLGFIAERFSSFYFTKHHKPIYSNISFINEED